jgi:hypothetical protein
MRIGYGWDSHEFKRGVPLKIGGIAIEHAKGLAGHSDGDVLLHALTDALLGAVAAGDIGTHFPPSDPQWKGADSTLFVRGALEKVRAAGFRVAAPALIGPWWQSKRSPRGLSRGERLVTKVSDRDRARGRQRPGARRPRASPRSASRS